MSAIHFKISSAKVGQDAILSHDQFASFQGVNDTEMKDSSAKVGQDGILSHDQFASFQGINDTEMKDSFFRSKYGKMSDRKTTA